MSSERTEGWGSVGQGKKLDEKKREKVYKELKNMIPKPHPLNEQVLLTYLLSKKDDDVEVTIIHALLPEGSDIPEHVHDVNDIIYPVSGKATIWIDGIGDLKLEKGVIVNVPPGVLHKVYDVVKELEVFDVFSGAIV